jgi:hypothetical protein
MTLSSESGKLPAGEVRHFLGANGRRPSGQEQRASLLWQAAAEAASLGPRRLAPR